MADSTVWWVLAGSFIAVELATSTFYLLMLSTGLVAGAIAAHLGAPVAGQLAVAAVIGGGAVVAWRRYRQNKPSTRSASSNPDVNMDVGQTVHVDAWDAEGNSTVKYRGANWAVSLRPGAPPATGLFRIVEIVGSRLVVEKL